MPKSFSHKLQVDTGAEEYVWAEVEFIYDSEGVEILAVKEIGGDYLDENTLDIDLSELATVAENSHNH